MNFDEIISKQIKPNPVIAPLSPQPTQLPAPKAVNPTFPVVPETWAQAQPKPRLVTRLIEMQRERFNTRRGINLK